MNFTKLNRLLASLLFALSLGSGTALAEPNSAMPYPIQTQIDYNAEKPAKKVLFSTPQYEMILFAFDKGQALKEHTVPFAAYIQVIEGEGQLLLKGQPITIKAGEGFVLPTGVPHSVKAPGRFKMLLLKQQGAL